MENTKALKEKFMSIVADACQAKVADGPERLVIELVQEWAQSYGLSLVDAARDMTTYPNWQDEFRITIFRKRDCNQAHDEHSWTTLKSAIDAAPDGIFSWDEDEWIRPFNP